MNDAPASSPDRLGPGRRTAAVAALVLVGLAVIIGTVLLLGDLARAVAAPVLLLSTTATAWVAVTRQGAIRLAAAAVTVLLLGSVIAIVVTAQDHGIGLVVVIGLMALSTGLVRYALRRDLATLEAAPVPGTRVGRARHGVLIANLASGGGKVERFGVVDECRRRGIEVIVLRPGDGLQDLARRAIEGGADVIGMAGGDGSQALVAAAAMAADVPMVCVPAGTRNHFANDLGLDRADVVAALGGFEADAGERRIDLASVNGKVFVNNVSLGLYASIIQSPSYRRAKRRTAATMLSDLAGPDTEPYDLQFVGPDGVRRQGARIIQISNNPYALTSAAAFGGRPRLDTGKLGVAAAEVRGAADVAGFVAAEWMHRLDRFSGWTLWETDSLVVASGAPVEAAIDGESFHLDPPLTFRILPGALRVRIPAAAPGYAPAALAPPSAWWTLSALVRAAAGHVTPL